MIRLGEACATESEEPLSRGEAGDQQQYKRPLDPLRHSLDALAPTANSGTHAIGLQSSVYCKTCTECTTSTLDEHSTNRTKV
jgi:hypothetical protein